MKNVILFVSSAVFFFSTTAIVSAGPFSGKTKDEYLADIEKLKQSNDKSNMPKDWGSCRDTCYDLRNQCYDMGGETYHCEALYDACTANCDTRY
jgi:hypothetical protein